VRDDESQSIKDRLNESAAALPYCLSKQATQIHVTNELANLSSQWTYLKQENPARWRGFQFIIEKSASNRVLTS